MSKRIARLNAQLRRELSELIRTQVRDPRVGIATITGVEVAADLGSAKIYVREIGGSDELAQTLEGLRAAAPFLRTMLGRSMHIRRVPELRFREDHSYQGARRIEELLQDVLPPSDAEGDEPDAADGPADNGADEAVRDSDDSGVEPEEQG